MKSFEGKTDCTKHPGQYRCCTIQRVHHLKAPWRAMDALLRHDVSEDDVHVAWVPGAFEIPLVASKMAKSESTML